MTENSGFEMMTLPIRYDGGDAEKHEVELLSLGQSLQGIARILAVSGHFAATQNYAKQMQALDVRITVREPRANCLTLDAVIQFAREQQLLAGIGGVAVTTLVSYIFARASRQKEEMKALKEVLQQSVDLLATRDSDLNARLLSTIDRLADALIPAARQAVAPIGGSVSTLTIGNAKPIDLAMAQSIREPGADELTAEREWSVALTEIDLETSSGKARLDTAGDDEERRVKVRFIDPAFQAPDNVYVRAFVNRLRIKIRGKASIRDGQITEIFAADSPP